MATATTGPPAHYGGPQAGPATGMGHQMSGWPPAGYHPQMDPQTAMMYLQYRPPVTAPPPSYAAGGRGPAGGVVGSGMQAYGAIRMPNFEGMQALGGITDGMMPPTPALFVPTDNIPCPVTLVVPPSLC